MRLLLYATTANFIKSLKLRWYTIQVQKVRCKKITQHKFSNLSEGEWDLHPPKVSSTRLVSTRFKAHIVSEHLRTYVEANSDMVNETCRQKTRQYKKNKTYFKNCTYTISPLHILEDMNLRYTTLFQFKCFSGVHICKIIMQTLKTFHNNRKKPKAFTKENK